MISVPTEKGEIESGIFVHCNWHYSYLVVYGVDYVMDGERKDNV